MFQELLVQWYGDLGTGGTDETRAVAFLRQGVERELAHHKERAAHLVDVQIHGILLIGKNAELGQLLAQPIDIFLRVGFFNAKQNHHSQADFRLHFPVDGDGSVCNSLCYNSHII